MEASKLSNAAAPQGCVGAKRSYANVVQGTHDKSSKKYDDMDCELSDATCQSTVSGK
jgi:hypothetical protein